MDANQNNGAQPVLSPMDRLGAILDAETPTEQLSDDEQDPEQEALAQDEEPSAEDPQPDEDESTEDEGEESEDQTSALEEVELDGKSFQVPPEIKAAVMRQQDYTRKTQALAVQHRQTAELEQVLQQKAQVVDGLADIVGDLRNLDLQINYLEKQVNLQDLRVNDPLEYSLKVTDLMAFKNQRDRLNERKENMARTVLQAEADYKANATAEGDKYLSSAIKGWGPQLRDRLVDHAVSIGFSKEQLNDVINPLNVILLHDSYLYHQGKSSNPTSKRVLQFPTATLRPGATPGKTNPVKLRARAEQRAKLHKSGNIKDAAALIRL
jgi:hypothetical protein